MLIMERTRIEVVLASLDLVPLLEEAFRGYSAGRRRGRRQPGAVPQPR